MHLREKDKPRKEGWKKSAWKADYLSLRSHTPHEALQVVLRSLRRKKRREEGQNVMTENVSLTAHHVNTAICLHKLSQHGPENRQQPSLKEEKGPGSTEKKENRHTEKSPKNSAQDRFDTPLLGAQYRREVRSVT